MSFRKSKMRLNYLRAAVNGVLMCFIIAVAVLVIGYVETSTTESTTVEIPLQSVVVEVPPAPIPEPEPAYTVDELFCMAAAIYNEAGADACSDETRRLVGYVVLNRVNHSSFPNTIREVLEQKSQYGRFYYTGVKFSDRASLPQEQHAVERAYEIARQVLESKVIPIPPTVVFQSERKQGPVYKYIDGIYFCHARG